MQERTVGQPKLAEQALELETPNFILRAMTPEDALLDWGSWFLDEEATRHLNMLPRNLTVDERRNYISRFNSHDAYMLGIFRKADNCLVGFWSIYVDLPRREFYLNVIIGAQGDRNHGIQNESCDRIYEYFFNDLKMNAVLCTVSAANPRMLEHLKRRRWTLNGTAHNTSAAGGSKVTIHSLRLTREEWLKRFEPGWTPAAT